MLNCYFKFDVDVIFRKLITLFVVCLYADVILLRRFGGVIDDWSINRCGLVVN